MEGVHGKLPASGTMIRWHCPKSNLKKTGETAAKRFFLVTLRTREYYVVNADFTMIQLLAIRWAYAFLAQIRLKTY
jgi:hypothetical protein